MERNNTFKTRNIEAIGERMCFIIKFILLISWFWYSPTQEILNL